MTRCVEFHLIERGGEWRVDLVRFIVKFVDGNLSLEQEERAPR
jgi:hypothetical protein